MKALAGNTRLASLLIVMMVLQLSLFSPAALVAGAADTSPGPSAEEHVYPERIPGERPQGPALMEADPGEAAIAVTPMGQGTTPGAVTVGEIQALADYLIGDDPDLEILEVRYQGTPESAGYFEGDRDIIGFERGIILSTGRAKDVEGPNTSDSTSTMLGLPGDDDLESLIPGYDTFDATVLEIDFIPQKPVLTFSYVFSSEEYPEFVGSPYNDVFGFFINGVNKALLPVTGEPVAINNVHAGNYNPYYSYDPNLDDYNGHLIEGKNSQFFRDNYFNPEGPSKINLEMDGLTTVLSFTAEVEVGEENTIKLAIADVTDEVWDSNVFIESFKAQDFIPVEGVSLNKASTSLLVGKTEQLVADVFPADATNRRVSWESEDEDIVTVSSTGLIEGIAEGSARVTATTEDGAFSAFCRVNVIEEEIEVDSVKINPANVRMLRGTQRTLVPEFNPPNATNQNVSWKSSDTTVVTVGDGVINALRPGEAIITVTTEDGGHTAKCNVLVYDTYAVTFEVQDEDEAPVTGASITLNGEIVFTDDQGKATFKRENGTYNYQVTAEGYIEVAGEVVVEGKAKIIPVTLEAEEIIPDTYRVTFEVQDEDEEAVSGAAVIINGEEKLTDEDGIAVFRLDGEQTYQYTVSAEGYDTVVGEVTVEGENVSVLVILETTVYYTLTVGSEGEGTTDPRPGVYTHRAGETVTLKAEPEEGWEFDRWVVEICEEEEDEEWGSLEGTAVLEGETAHGDITVKVVVSTPQGTTYTDQVMTDEDGVFYFSMLPVGSALLTASKEGYYSTSATARVEADVTVTLQDKMVLYPKEDSGSLEGHAKFIDRDDHKGILIRVQTLEGKQLPNLIAQTDSDGYFSFDSIPVDPGSGSRYIFTAFAQNEAWGYGTDSIEAKVEADQQTTLGSTLWLRPAAVNVMIFADDTTPWNTSALHDMLDEMVVRYNIRYTIHSSQDMATVDLPLDNVVWIINDQVQSFYDAYADNQEKFADFVNRGGTLIFEACDGGWNNGSIMTPGGKLPGGVENPLVYDYFNTNVNPTHPMMAGVDIDLSGNYASHNYFTPLPGDATILCKDMQGNPTLVEYKHGQGRVIATGQPLQFYWDTTNSLRQIYLNFIYYTFNIPIEVENNQGNGLAQALSVSGEEEKPDSSSAFAHLKEEVNQAGLAPRSQGYLMELTENGDNVEVYYDEEIQVIMDSNICATAYFVQQFFLVLFVDYDGTELYEEEVAYGESATAPEDPTREGHTFTGWDKDFTNVTADLVVTAQYEAYQYTVTFESNGGSEVPDQLVSHGSLVTEPEEPTRDKYEFDGWFREAGLNNEWDFAGDTVETGLPLEVYVKEATFIGAIGYFGGTLEATGPAYDMTDLTVTMYGEGILGKVDRNSKTEVSVSTEGDFIFDLNFPETEANWQFEVTDSHGNIMCQLMEARDYAVGEMGPSNIVTLYAKWMLTEIDIYDIKPGVDMYVKAGDVVEISFRSNVIGGEAYFRVLMPLVPQLTEVNLPMDEVEDDPGFYRAYWTVPEELLARDAVVEVIISTADGLQAQAYAPGKLTIDTIDPSITLLGDGVIYLVAGEAYEEFGATARDYLDGDLTGDITIDGLADGDILSEPGIYTVTYNVTDHAGNQAPGVTREVIVAPPAVTAEGVLETPESGSIKVTGALEGAILTLYDAEGSIVAVFEGEEDPEPDPVLEAMAAAYKAGNYVFKGVPAGSGYYVTQTVNGVESAPSAPVTIALLGDVNEDGRITVMDAVLVLRYIVGLEELSPWQQILADYNQDGRVTVMDARGIALLIVNR